MYERALVAFFDILGFRALIEERSPEQVAKILDHLSRCSGTDGDTGAHCPPTIIKFSDSIVRVRHVEREDNRQFPTGLMFHEVLDLIHVQLELINEGVLVRGGLTYGDISVERDQVFGPALIEAYDLESLFARYPRIAVSPVALRELDTNPLLRSADGPPGWDQKHMKELLSRGDDGIWHLDYLRVAQDEFSDPAEYFGFIARHREMIEKSNSERPVLSSKAVKYNWLTLYHNSVVSRFDSDLVEEYGCQLDELLVETDHKRSLHDFLKH